VAERLYLSANTVRTHLRNLMAKLGVHSTLEAVAMVRGGELSDRPPVGLSWLREPRRSWPLPRSCPRAAACPAPTTTWDGVRGGRRRRGRVDVGQRRRAGNRSGHLGERLHGRPVAQWPYRRATRRTARPATTSSGTTRPAGKSTRSPPGACTT